MSKSLKKKNHWTNKVHEAVITRGKEGELGFESKGGAEIGQFPYFGEVKQGKGLIQSGKLAQDELLLEVNNMPVAGLTTRDVLAVIKHCKDPVRLKCVKQGGVVDKDLRHYLNLRFSKGSVDHDHQQIIRDNLYLRTVPCESTSPVFLLQKSSHRHNPCGLRVDMRVYVYVVLSVRVPVGQRCHCRDLH
uniref:PDZ domain-containing protein n=1 Tax=Cyclopterus lumpus TaxID=8103 RepID=A0A8C2WMS0_CYCLU